MKTRMILKSAAKTTADFQSCGIFDEAGNTIKLELQRGIYEVPGGPDHDRMVGLLTKAGFEFLERVEEEGDEPEKPKTPAPSKGQKYNALIRLQHPDYTPSNAVSANVMVPVEGADPQRVEVVDGFVETQDPQVVAYLVAQGFIVMNPFDLEKETGA